MNLEECRGRTGEVLGELQRERRQRSVLQVQVQQGEAEGRRLRVQLAEQEARGGGLLRAREEALQSLGARVGGTEQHFEQVPTL